MASTPKVRPRRTSRSIVWGVEARYLSSSKVFRWNSGQTGIFRDFVRKHHPNHKSCDPTPLYQALELDGYEDVETETGASVADIIRVKINRKMDSVARDMARELENRAHKRAAKAQPPPVIDDLHNAAGARAVHPRLEPKTEATAVHFQHRSAPTSPPATTAREPPQKSPVLLRPRPSGSGSGSHARSQLPSPPTSPASPSSSHTMGAGTPQPSSPIRSHSRHAVAPPPVVVPPTMKMPRGLFIHQHAITPADRDTQQQNGRRDTARRIAPKLAEMARLHERLHALTLSVESDCASQRDWLHEWKQMFESSLAFDERMSNLQINIDQD